MADKAKNNLQHTSENNGSKFLTKHEDTIVDMSREGVSASVRKSTASGSVSANSAMLDRTAKTDSKFKIKSTAKSAKEEIKNTKGIVNDVKGVAENAVSEEDGHTLRVVQSTCLLRANQITRDENRGLTRLNHTKAKSLRHSAEGAESSTRASFGIKRKTNAHKNAQLNTAETSILCSTNLSATGSTARKKLTARKEKGRALTSRRWKRAGAAAGAGAGFLAYAQGGSDAEGDIASAAKNASIKAGKGAYGAYSTYRERKVASKASFGKKTMLKRARASAQATLSTTSNVAQAAQSTKLTTRIIDTFRRIVAAFAALVPSIAPVLVPIIIGLLLVLVLGSVLGLSQQSSHNLSELSDVEREVAEYLLAKNVPDVTIAAIMGNMYRECHFDPDIVSGDGHDSYGLIQFTNERRTGLESYAAYINSKPSLVNTQMNYMWMEFTGEETKGCELQFGHNQWQWSGYGYARTWAYNNGFTGDANWDEFKSITDVAKATRYFGYAMERCADGESAGWDVRESAARRYLEILRGSTGSLSGKAQIIVDAARSQLGVPYVSGGHKPNVGLDCSGLTSYCYSCAGITITPYTYSQKEELRTISLEEAQAGDILYNGEHVAIYIGNDQYIHEPYPGKVCEVASGINYFDCALTYR